MVLPNFCQCAVSSTQKFLVQQHIQTSKHQSNKQRNFKQRQLFLTEPTTSNAKSEFNIKLCRDLVSADIPLYKLENEIFREFLQEYTQHTIPDDHEVMYFKLSTGFSDQVVINGYWLLYVMKMHFILVVAIVKNNIKTPTDIHKSTLRVRANCRVLTQGSSSTAWTHGESPLPVEAYLKLTKQIMKCSSPRQAINYQTDFVLYTSSTTQ
ncbi:hypothetical protein C0J52_05708 [Blattella germanica]|nr:hypothetical protein C0J52_05708 [Blattella germanica]